MKRGQVRPARGDVPSNIRLHRRTDAARPACAGMYPASGPAAGDRGFPPRARGCTKVDSGSRKSGTVSPAGAGMHHGRPAPDMRTAGGDVPQATYGEPDGARSAPQSRGPYPPSPSCQCRRIALPRARGCTYPGDLEITETRLCPARAGMYRRWGICQEKLSAMIHVPYEYVGVQAVYSRSDGIIQT